MDREATMAKVKSMKAKAKAARKAGKREQALAFVYGMKRLQRALKAAEPKIRKKKSEMAAKEAVPGQITAPAAAS
ncbi:MAG: hypothetical protein HY903_14265 [Deltaproteobacteria bacterium]|nr:hypothetical protein [Deltaproteobacteria bacterium]